MGSQRPRRVASGDGVLILSFPRPCSLAPSITTPLYSTTVSKALRGALRSQAVSELRRIHLPCTQVNRGYQRKFVLLGSSILCFGAASSQARIRMLPKVGPPWLRPSPSRSSLTAGLLPPHSVYPLRRTLGSGLCTQPTCPRATVARTVPFGPLWAA